MIKKSLALLSFILLINPVIFAQIEDRLGLSRLLETGTINVTIGGDFIVTGTFPALITERADAFITRVFNDTREKLLQSALDEESRRRALALLDKYTLRGIKLKRSNGDEIIVDLEKFRVNGDLNNNPYLRNDDVLIFNVADLERNFFQVHGAVNKPGTFHFVDGDRLRDAIELAQGINRAYENVTEVEISRLSYDGHALIQEKYNISDDVQLKRGDIIRVLADETQRKGYSVMVLGEVFKPGTIPVTKNSTTLGEVIEKAGGVTEQASLKRARLYKGTTVSLLLERLYGIELKEFPDQFEFELSETLSQIETMLMYRMSNVNEEDSAFFFIEDQLRIFLQSGPVDFSALKEDDSEAANYIVNHGDVIIIPQKTNKVFVFGHVRKPGHITFIPGRDYNYYVNRAGGLGEYADGDIMLIKSETREWINAVNKGVIIEEGDYIYIPRTPARSFRYYVKLVNEYLGIVGPLATIILLVVNLSK
jgi:protein involved in polysaccharide export with SLBB domain